MVVAEEMKGRRWRRGGVGGMGGVEGVLRAMETLVVWAGERRWSLADRLRPEGFN